MIEILRFQSILITRAFNVRKSGDTGVNIDGVINSSISSCISSRLSMREWAATLAAYIDVMMVAMTSAFSI